MDFFSASPATSDLKTDLNRGRKANAVEQEETEAAEKSQYDMGFLSASSATSCLKTKTESWTKSKRI